MLRLLGLFDRPADPGCLAALRQPPAIPGLTKPLAGLDEEEWNLVVSGLESAGLVETTPWEPKRVKGFGEEKVRKAMDAGAKYRSFPLSELEDFTPPHGFPAWVELALDAHPLLRQYFAKRLRETAAQAWREGHRRLYQHLKASVPYWPEGLDGLQPLYQAVAHGCQAGNHQTTLDDVYRPRILRQDLIYPWYLGAFGTDLAGLSGSFESQWSRPISMLEEENRVYILHQAAAALRAMGWLSEAIDPFKMSLEGRIKLEMWSNAAASAGNLCDISMTLGDLRMALGFSEQSVSLARRSNNLFTLVNQLTKRANILRLVGRLSEAEDPFKEAEREQATRKSSQPQLSHYQGFLYCELLLDLQIHEEVKHRAENSLRVKEDESPLSVALDHLLLGRVRMHEAISKGTDDLASARAELDEAVNGMRQAAQAEFLPRGLLSRAWLRSLEGNTDGARADLDEAQQIAERGPMRLHLADVHLHRARLFCDKEELKHARALIEHCGYWRRKQELEDAEEAARHW